MVDPSIFSDFVPTATLSAGERADLARRSSWVELAPGQSWWIGGARDELWYFLAEGRLAWGEAPVRTLSAKTPAARRALNVQFRDPVDVRAETHCRLLRVDRKRLDLLLTWSQIQGIEVTEVEDLADSEEADWMTLLLSNPALRHVPAPLIAQLFACFQTETFLAGATIIREGDPGDRYYVIARGHVEVWRRRPEGGEARLNVLGPGRGFGEEALLSGAPRNATVRAAEEVVLMSLSQRDFRRLLERSVVRDLAPEECGDWAVLLDVRMREEYEAGHLPGAMNIPLAEIRAAAERLPRDRIYAVYCDTGGRSAAAAWLLCERGFDARRLRSPHAPGGGIA